MTAGHAGHARITDALTMRTMRKRCTRLEFTPVRAALLAAALTLSLRATR